MVYLGIVKKTVEKPFGSMQNDIPWTPIGDSATEARKLYTQYYQACKNMKL